MDSSIPVMSGAARFDLGMLQGVLVARPLSCAEFHAFLYHTYVGRRTLPAVVPRENRAWPAATGCRRRPASRLPLPSYGVRRGSSGQDGGKKRPLERRLPNGRSSNT